MKTTKPLQEMAKAERWPVDFPYTDRQSLRDHTFHKSTGIGKAGAQPELEQVNIPRNPPRPDCPFPQTPDPWNLGTPGRFILLMPRVYQLDGRH